jgi:hypothetical protein
MTVSIFAIGLYNYFLHPLSHVKGPLLARVTPVSHSVTCVTDESQYLLIYVYWIQVWIVRAVAGHRLNRDIESLHRRYGKLSQR